jgi:hypothetical protein
MPREVVVKGGGEPPTFRFSGASVRSLHVAERGLISDLAAETIAGCRLVWPHACRCWLPVWLPQNQQAWAAAWTLSRSGRER